MDTLTVARRVAEFSPGSLPDPVRRAAEVRLRDTVAVALRGSLTPAARVAASAVAADAGRFAALVPGAPRLSATSAGLLSGVAASALDADDGHYRGGAIHPSSVVVPAVLVAASTTDVGFERMVAAVVAGYEVAVRVAHLRWPVGPDSPWHCTGTAAAVGGAVGAAHVWGAEVDEIDRALRTAWANAPSAALQWPMQKEAIGWATATALGSATLARAGWMRSELPGSWGAPPIFPPTPFDEPRAVADDFVWSLGERFEIEQGYLKPYAACRYTHTAADVLSELRRDGLAAEDVVAIRVMTHSWATFLDHRRPVSLEHAQYSYPFVLAAVAVEGDAGPDQVSAQRLTDPVLLAFADRVSVHHEPALDEALPDAYGTRLEIELTDGRTLRPPARLRARGDVESPLSEEELVAKVSRFVGPVEGVDAAALVQLWRDRPSSGQLWATLGGAGMTY